MRRVAKIVLQGMDDHTLNSANDAYESLHKIREAVDTHTKAIYSNRRSFPRSLHVGDSWMALKTHDIVMREVWIVGYKRTPLQHTVTGEITVVWVTFVLICDLPYNPLSSLWSCRVDKMIECINPFQYRISAKNTPPVLLDTYIERQHAHTRHEQ